MNLDGFPVAEWRAGRPLYRLHRAENGPWWFSADGSGRFDPVEASGRGTCYLARAPLGAWVEVFRKTMLIPEGELHARRLLETALPRTLRLADLTSRAALEHGVTASLGADSDYTDSQRFAGAAVSAGLDGILHYVRHDPAQRLTGVALFAEAGEKAEDDPDWPRRSDEPVPDDLIAQARSEFGYRVLPIP